MSSATVFVIRFRVAPNSLLISYPYIGVEHQAGYGVGIGLVLGEILDLGIGCKARAAGGVWHEAAYRA